MTITREKAEGLVIKTYHQFSEPLAKLYMQSHADNSMESREVREIYFNYANAVGANPDDKDIAGKIKNNLGSSLKTASDAELCDILLDCHELSNLYNLPVIKEIPPDPVIADDPKSRWLDNGNGTFTAMEGATLWGLYGSEWRDKSGYTGDPAKLQKGTVVGRNNDVIEAFDSGFGIEVKKCFGEHLYNVIRDFVVNDAAFPAKHIGLDDINDYFGKLGLEMDELDDDETEKQNVTASTDDWWWLKEGTAVHVMIGEIYRNAHKPDTVKHNFSSIKSILNTFSEEYDIPDQSNTLEDNEGKDLRKRPDITNISKCHIYEIKPARYQKKAREDVNMYQGILNKALAPVGIFVALGSVNEPGVKGKVSTTRNIYSYESPEEGVITYKKMEPKQQEQPFPVPVPVRVPVREKIYLENIKYWEKKLGLKGKALIAALAVLTALTVFSAPLNIIPLRGSTGLLPIIPSYNHNEPNEPMS